MRFSIDFTSGKEESNPLTLHNIHGLIMFFAWGVLIPFGALFARYAKPLPNDMWFLVHRPIQILGVVFCLSGFIVALVMSDHHFEFLHGQIGLTLIVIAVLQIVIAVLRPEKDGGRVRCFWEGFHAWGGRALILVSWGDVGLGILRAKLDRRLIYGFSGYCGCIVVLVIGMEIRNFIKERNNERKIESDGGELKIELTSDENQIELEVNGEESNGLELSSDDKEE